ncbi:MAG: sodium:solute symporter [Verrucomicrobiales bacterium]|nr:sodium:solute symporter [Verrucomicrobiales bacterium]|tara:strand:+ start:13396 stop:15012 length:1617 start_codon:yes stop_codon:yes gene_type:complete
MQLRTVDLLVLLLYMAGVFGLGCWFARKSRKPNEFMAAGRSLPGWAVGLSIFGTYVSSIGFLGNTGKAYGGTWNSWVFGLSLPIAAVIAVRWFIPLYRSGEEVSAYYHLEKRFGPWARTYALVCYLLSQLARIGTILYLVALALAPLTGWSVVWIIFITGILVTLYTLLGGIEAVIWTDVIQSIVLVAGAIFCASLILTGMPEGSGQLFEIAKENDKFSLGGFELSPASFTAVAPTFWIVLIYGVFINLQNFGIDQSFVQRYVTAKSDRDAKFSVWFATLLFPIVSALFFFIGTGLFSLYQTNPEMLNEVKAQVAATELARDNVEVTDASIAQKAATLEAKDIGDKVLPHFIVNKLPIGLAGLLIAAIFAAAMSSMDTSLNSSATLFLCDIYKRYFNPDADDRQSMRVLYTATLVVGIAGTFTALAMINVKSALDAWWKLQGIFTGGMLGLFLLGLISRKARNPHAVVAATVGVLLIMWMSLSKTEGWKAAVGGMVNPLHSFMTIILGTSSIVLVGVLASWLLPGPKPTNDPDKPPTP